MNEKTKEQLLNEIHELKAKIAELEKYKTSDLTEIKMAKKTAIEERNKAQQYINIADVMLLSLDSNGSIILINPKGCEMLGYAKEELIGKNWFDLALPEDQKELVKEVAKKVFSGEVEAVKYYENNIITKSGEKRIIAFHNSVLQDKNGNIVGTLSSGEDITEQRKIQESLAEALSFNETLLNTSPDIIYLYDLIESRNIYSNEGVTKILGYSVDEIKEMGDQLISTLMHKDDFKTYLDEIVPRYQKAKDGEIIEHEYRMKDKNGEWWWLLSKESIFQRKADATPKQIFGIISDITDRKIAEDTLKISELKYKNQVNFLDTIIDSSPFAMWISDADGFLIRANQSLREILNVTDEQIVGTYNVIQDQNLKEQGLLQNVQAVFSDFINTRFTMFWMGTKVGSGLSYKETNDIWIDVSMFPILDEKGKLINVVCQYVDITEQKLAEKNLIESEKKFRDLLQSTPLPIVYVNKEGVFTFRNDRFIKTFGYTDKEVPGINEWWEKAYPDEEYRQWVMKNWEDAVLNSQKAGSDIESDVYKVTSRDGIVRDVIISGITIGDDLLATLIDITELKQTENNLVKEKEYSEELVNALPGVFYQISTQGKFVNWNRNFETVSGYSHKEMGQISPIDLFEGADKKRIAESIAHVFSHGSVFVEAGLTSKEGIKVPYFFTGKRILINELPVLVGMGIDISELKEAENELKKYHEQLEELVKERTADLEAKNKELDDAMKVFVGRELTIRNLQEKIRVLEGK